MAQNKQDNITLNLGLVVRTLHTDFVSFLVCRVDTFNM